MGDRPDELSAAVASVLQQVGAVVEVIVVANGLTKDRLVLPADQRIRVIEVATNAGIPGGRNIGAGHAVAPLLVFLDDDARLVGGDVLSRSAELFATRARLGVIALRIVDETGSTARRHVPRVGSRGADRSSPVTAFLGGACAIRAAAFHDAGGFPAAFQYAMEETDLALRLVDRDWELWYDGQPAVFHPATDPGRHPSAAERTIRNRVWLAHRNLPAAIAALYVADWLAITSARRPQLAVALGRSAWRAWRARPGPRVPIRWRTVLRLTRLGRPPII